MESMNCEMDNKKYEYIARTAVERCKIYGQYFEKTQVTDIKHIISQVDTCLCQSYNSVLGYYLLLGCPERPSVIISQFRLLELSITALLLHS